MIATLKAQVSSKKKNWLPQRKSCPSQPSSRRHGLFSEPLGLAVGDPTYYVKSECKAFIHQPLS
jgi:hypothetical protein